ncbi:MAG TPA: HDIG domain-containing protein [Bacteroidales bacterium]|nr:HDIG domain-containing protein [Bacteroidales bacterium]
MLNIFKYIRSHLKLILVILYFALATLLIANLFPKQGKFRFEFQKGRPWMHEDLQAPFDFPIYRSQLELAREKDSVLSDFKPYYNYEEAVFSEQGKRFREVFGSMWREYSLSEFRIPNEQIYFNNSRYKELRNLELYFEEYILNQLDQVYQKGIIDISANEYISPGGLSAVMVVRKNIAEQVIIDAIFTPKSAYEYMNKNIDEELLRNTSPFTKRYRQFFKNFDINNFLKVNVFYDQEKSKTISSSLFNEISLYRDKIQEGQRIISRGELVTSDKYQILESLRIEYEHQLGFIASQLVRVGRFILVFAALFVIFLFLYNLRYEILGSSLKTLFILMLVILMVFVASAIVSSGRISIYVIPFAILPIILRTFYDERLALFIHFITTILVGFFAPNSFEFVFLTFIAGIIAVFSLTNFNRRSRIVYTAMLVFLTYGFVYLGISIVQEGNVKEIDYSNFAWFGLNSFLILLSFPLIFIFEKLFGFLSDATLMELADTNQPLLRELAEKAPGTFQHSLQVANLAEDAIYRIGGNPLLVRTGALYHDIGKIVNPIYFIENQASDINPHDKLAFEESAKVIINHVEKGVEIARKHNLPQPVIDFIRTHHGTSTVHYFYRSYIKKYPEESVDIKKFSYAGPKPFSKETAVLMMADSVEAASRSLKDMNIQSLENMVDGIIDSQLIEEQFNNADITFKDITTIKEVFRRRLTNIYHVRISYPA